MSAIFSIYHILKPIFAYYLHKLGIINKVYSINQQHFNKDR